MNPNGLIYSTTKTKADKAKVKEYIKQGMTRKAAVLKAKK
ncbi:hypothetical protein [Escherichia phage BF17]|nr:hypothetical protein [Escherichia phage BF17]QXN76610.1 hypothetical protein [Escherichia phage BF17]